ncbi:MAG: ACT domain-containing protein [Desulfomonilaceae bacterium]
MPAPSRETHHDYSLGSPCAVLELIVNNHPGVMSHVCGLLSRRAFNVEGILCLPIEWGKGKQSRIWLLLDAKQPLDQMIKQMAKLQDVLHVRALRADLNVFLRVERLILSDLSYRPPDHFL